MPDLTEILQIENGHTQWARTRRMPLVVRSSNSNTLDGQNDWPDAVTSNLVLTAPLPSDWVHNTSITFVAGILQIATASDPNVVTDSQISIEVLNVGTAAGVSYSDTNLENASTLTTALTQNEVRRYARTITGATLSSVITDPQLSWRLQWVITRQGGHGSDAVNALVRFRTAWIEYTAFM